MEIVKIENYAGKQLDIGKKVYCFGPSDTLLPKPVWQQIDQSLAPSQVQSALVTISLDGTAYDIVLSYAKREWFDLVTPYPVYFDKLETLNNVTFFSREKKENFYINLPYVMVAPFSFIKAVHDEPVTMSTIKTRGGQIFSTGGCVKFSGDGDLDFGEYAIRTGGSWTEYMDDAVSKALIKRSKDSFNDKHGHVEFLPLRDKLPEYDQQEIYIGDPCFFIPDPVWDRFLDCIPDSFDPCAVAMKGMDQWPITVVSTWGDGLMPISRGGEIIAEADVEAGLIALIPSILREKMGAPDQEEISEHGALVTVSGRPAADQGVLRIDDIKVEGIRFE